MTSLPEPYYDDGQITIFCGDCRDVLPALEAGSVDLVLTDPPYGINAHRMTLGNGHKRIYRGEREWDTEAPDIHPLFAFNCPMVIWGGNYFELPSSRCWFVWDKGTGDNDYADCELAWTNRDAVTKRYFRSWVGANAKERHESLRFHPTQKPVELMRWCIGFFPDARSILDPFMGAGATLLAARDLGRRAIGIEIEERYCEIAARRLRQSVLPLEMEAAGA